MTIIVKIKKNEETGKFIFVDSYTEEKFPDNDKINMEYDSFDDAVEASKELGFILIYPKEQLLEEISKFLDTPNIADYGWPDVSQKEHEELYYIIQYLIDIKFSRDGDGDSVYKLILLDKKKYDMPILTPVKRIRDHTSFEELSNIFYIAMNNAENAFSFVRKITRYLDSYKDKITKEKYIA